VGRAGHQDCGAAESEARQEISSLAATVENPGRGVWGNERENSTYCFLARLDRALKIAECELMNTLTPGKLKAVYLLWLFLNLMLLVLSPSPFGKMKTSYSGKIDYAAGRLTVVSTQ